MKKKFFAILMFMLLLALSITPTTWATTVDSGACGDNLTWTLDSNGTLTISGTGAMWDYENFGDAPWTAYPIFSQVKEITINNGITNIGQKSFYGLNNLITVNIPESVNIIDNYAFWQCSNLTNIDIGNGVYYIGQDAFYNCVKLNNITLPNSLKNIDTHAFRNCQSLTEINIPQNVIRLELNAFTGCNNLTDISVNPNNTEYSSIDGVLYNKEKTTLLLCPEGKQSCNIPNGVTEIENSAFSSCGKLTHITMPNSIEKIGFSAFSDCTSLTSIELPQNLKTISMYAFSDCTALTEIQIPDGLKSININTFSGCRNLQTIYIPTSITSISTDCFANCISLTTVYYAGNEIQWGSIKISDGNAELSNATIICLGNDTPIEPENPDTPTTPTTPEEPTIPTTPDTPATLPITTKPGGLGSKLTVRITGGHWLTIQVRRAGSIAITSIQAPGQGTVEMIFSAAAGSTVQVWETEQEMTFTNGVPDNKILAVSVKNV